MSLAKDYLEFTKENVFLTGKAGTGKTTFLHVMKKTLSKRKIITAPTGVAAINAGGVTLHSFFQLPFTPFLSNNNELHSQHRLNKENIKIINSIDLLIIDEISMVRADLLDAIDAALRHYRKAKLPFGGVQLLMIGDLYQLPPVLKNEEWGLLKNHYGWECPTPNNSQLGYSRCNTRHTATEKPNYLVY